MFSFIYILSNESIFGKCYLLFSVFIIAFFVIAQVPSASGQEVLFDFDNAPIYTSLPIDQTVNGITAHLSATGQGYSIQNANVLGFTPPGFAGRIVYPNSIFLSDLRVHFDQTINDFSIMYSCQELGCDDAATMKVTAYKNGIYVGFNTRTATFPGTWPVDTLRCSFPQGFDSVVVHYFAHPPTCQDYGTIFMADNMRVTPLTVNVLSESGLPGTFSLMQNYPNPFNPETKIRYELPNNEFVKLVVFDAIGREVETMVNEKQTAGTYEISFYAAQFPSGVYFYKLSTDEFSDTKKMLLIK